MWRKHANIFVRCLAVVLLVSIYGLCCRAAVEGCAGVNSQTLANISKYVQRKSKLPTDVNLHSTDMGLVTGTCFRKIKTVSSNKTFPFSQTLFLSPDQNTLVTGVFNLRVDPVEEERQERLELQAQVTAGKRPTRGAPDSSAAIVIFSDFQCPFCKATAAGLKDIDRQMPNVRLVYRYLPLESHNWSRRAAEAGACVFRQGNDVFWSFHDSLFAHQDEINDSNFQSKITTLAGSIPGIDTKSMLSCMTSHQSEADVDEDLKIAAEHEINATPTFVINGFVLPGAKTAAELKSIIASQSSTGRRGN